MLPLKTLKCPCCNGILHIPMGLKYIEKCDKKCDIFELDFLNFTIIKTIFKYIQIYSIYHELTDIDLHIIDCVATNFNLEIFKNYLKNNNFVNNNNEHVKKLFSELFFENVELFYGERKFLVFNKNFFKHTCLIDNIKIYSILIYLRHKTNIYGKLLTFDDVFIKIIQQYFITNNIPINKYRKCNINSPYSHVTELLFHLNLNVSENFRLLKKKKRKNRKSKLMVSK